jgi:demethylmenaquinone methyltransferase/2-methoxy-6-polyprenyl-1,4-benzoquinol methylase
MALQKAEIAQVYDKRAKRYDLTSHLYYLLGFRLSAFRKMAVHALDLKRGDTVVEIGCGTGLNFPLLQAAVGPRGKIVGVDLSAEMLAVAGETIKRNNWKNIELVHSDAATYQFPDAVDGVISTGAITYVPQYDQVIERGAKALASGKRFVILDFKKPAKWPLWLTKFFFITMRPFGVTLDITERHPWESIDRHLRTVQFIELYFGGAYLCVGEAP